MDVACDDGLWFTVNGERGWAQLKDVVSTEPLLSDAILRIIGASLYIECRTLRILYSSIENGSFQQLDHFRSVIQRRII